MVIITLLYELLKFIFIYVDDEILYKLSTAAQNYANLWESPQIFDFFLSNTTQFYDQRTFMVKFKDLEPALGRSQVDSILQGHKLNKS